MTTKKTLEEFIKEYVDKKIEDGEIKGVGDYSISTLSRPDDFGKRERAILSSLTGGAEYGKSGERLSDMGLTGSGYSKYLSGLYEKKISDLMNTRTANKDYTGSGYSDYLSKYVTSATSLYGKELEKEAKKREEVQKERESYEKLILTVSDRIVNEELINYNKAFELALSMGLSSDDASYVANSATEKAHDKIRLDVLEKIILNNLDSDKALSLAMSRGLTEDDADMLSAAAKEINEDIKNDGYAKSYLDYLREQEALKKKENEENKR